MVQPGAATSGGGGGGGGGIPPGQVVATRPHATDVLCGRGGRINSHPGNVHFRSLVDQHKRQYLDPGTKKAEKARIAASIVHAIRRLRQRDDSGEGVGEEGAGGRFLKEDPRTGHWIEIGDDKAIRKAGQALRECAPELRAERDERMARRKTVLLQGKMGGEEYDGGGMGGEGGGWVLDGGGSSSSSSRSRGKGSDSGRRKAAAADPPGPRYHPDPPERERLLARTTTNDANVVDVAEVGLSPTLPDDRVLSRMRDEYRKMQQIQTEQARRMEQYQMLSSEQELFHLQSDAGGGGGGSPANVFSSRFGGSSSSRHGTSHHGWLKSSEKFGSASDSGQSGRGMISCAGGQSTGNSPLQSYLAELAVTARAAIAALPPPAQCGNNSSSASSIFPPRHEWDVQDEYLKMHALLKQRNQLAELSTQLLHESSKSKTQQARQRHTEQVQGKREQNPYAQYNRDNHTSSSHMAFDRQYSSTHGGGIDDQTLFTLSSTDSRSMDMSSLGGFTWNNSAISNNLSSMSFEPLNAGVINNVKVNKNNSHNSLSQLATMSRGVCKSKNNTLSSLECKPINQMHNMQQQQRQQQQMQSHPESKMMMKMPQQEETRQQMMMMHQLQKFNSGDSKNHVSFRNTKEEMKTSMNSFAIDEESFKLSNIRGMNDESFRLSNILGKDGESFRLSNIELSGREDMTYCPSDPSGMPSSRMGIVHTPTPNNNIKTRSSKVDGGGGEDIDLSSRTTPMTNDTATHINGSLGKRKDVFTKQGVNDKDNLKLGGALSSMDDDDDLFYESFKSLEMLGNDDTDDARSCGTIHRQRQQQRGRLPDPDGVMCAPAGRKKDVDELKLVTKHSSHSSSRAPTLRRSLDSHRRTGEHDARRLSVDSMGISDPDFGMSATSLRSFQDDDWLSHYMSMESIHNDGHFDPWETEDYHVEPSSNNNSDCSMSVMGTQRMVHASRA